MHKIDPEAMSALQKKVPETLKDWLVVTFVLWGVESKQYRFICDKILDQGEDELVVAHYSQMLILLQSLDNNDAGE